jgi:hypothetical protein
LYKLAHALTMPVFVRRDDGLLAPAIVRSPVVALADLPVLGRYSSLRPQHRSLVVNDRRIAPVEKPRSTPARQSVIGSTVSLKGSR